MTQLRQLDSHDRTIILSDGRILGYREYGSKTGKPLIFFHGWPSSRFHGSAVHDAAKELRIRVISIDRPGIGLSDDQPDRTLLDWPDDVCEVADKLKIKKFSVLGVSGGGPYTAVCAYKIPDRIEKAGIVVGLAPTYIPGILNGMPIHYKLGWKSYAVHPIFCSLACYLHLWTAKFFPGLISFGYMTEQDRKIIEELRKTYPGEALEPFRRTINGAARDLELYTHPWGFDIKDIQKKIFLWYGEKDKNVPKAMGEYYASHLRQSTIVFYPNEGHLISRRHAKEILRKLFTR